MKLNNRAQVEPKVPELVSDRLLGVDYDVVDRVDLFDFIRSSANGTQPANILNVNTHAMNLAYVDEVYRGILNAADLVFVDGAGVQLGAKLLGKPVGERLTPMDWIDDLFSLCAEEKWSVFFLGDSEMMRERFISAINQRHPNCRIADSYHGFFEKDGEENDELVERINNSGARVLLIGMGMPIQEKWLWANRHRLKPLVRFSVGALNRVYTGDIARGPAWMTNNGMEWLYRLCVQPVATWRRYVLGNPLFLFRVLRSRLFRGEG